MTQPQDSPHSEGENTALFSPQNLSALPQSDPGPTPRRIAITFPAGDLDDLIFYDSYIKRHSER